MTVLPFYRRFCRCSTYRKAGKRVSHGWGREVQTWRWTAQDRDRHSFFCLRTNFCDKPDNRYDYFLSTMAQPLNLHASTITTLIVNDAALRTHLYFFPGFGKMWRQQWCALVLLSSRQILWVVIIEAEFWTGLAKILDVASQMFSIPTYQNMLYVEIVRTEIRCGKLRGV